MYKHKLILVISIYICSTIALILFVCSHFIHSIKLFGLVREVIFFGVEISINILVDISLYIAISLIILSNILVIILFYKQ